MKYLRVLADESAHEAFKNGSEYVEPHICYLKNSGGIRLKAYTPPQVLVGDVAYWDGSSVKTTPLSEWNTSLGTPIGVVVVPKGFAPDGRPRIISLKFASGDESYVTWGVFDEETSLTNFKRVPTTDNSSSTSIGSDSYGYLPSDIYTGSVSFVDPKAKYSKTSNLIPSPYLGDVPNPEYSKEISGYNNALSDFNGLSNTDTLVALDSVCEAANIAYKYNDGASNLKWYLPAMGELGYLMPRFNEIDNVITALGGEPLAIDGYWSSSEYNSRGAYYLGTRSGYVSNVDKSDAYLVRPFSIL